MQHIKLMICILQSICDKWRRWTHLFLEAQPVQLLPILVVWFLQHSPAVPMSQCHVLLNSYTCCRCSWANLSSEHPDDMDLAEQRIECNSSLFTTLVGCVDRIEAQLGMCTRWFRGHRVVGCDYPKKPGTIRAGLVDAMQWYRFFQSRCGFDEKDIRLLADDAGNVPVESLSATRDNVILGLKWLPRHGCASCLQRI